MSLLVLAYPDLSREDRERIRAFREHHDELYYRVVEPHFTLVFPTSGWSEADFLEETRTRVAQTRAFDFCIRCAELNKDAFSDMYHTLLVPDEGYSHIVKLHDALYAGKLFLHRALQVDFTPHIGVGNSPDPHICLAQIAAWNEAEFAIHGRVSTLDVVRYENNTVTTFAQIALRP